MSRTLCFANGKRHALVVVGHLDRATYRCACVVARLAAHVGTSSTRRDPACWVLLPPRDTPRGRHLRRSRRAQARRAHQATSKQAAGEGLVVKGSSITRVDGERLGTAQLLDGQQVDVTSAQLARPNGRRFSGAAGGLRYARQESSSVSSKSTCGRVGGSGAAAWTRIA